MTTNNNLDALSQNAELRSFGHPGRRSDDTPEGFEPSPLVDQGPERDYTLDEYGRVVHYGPGGPPPVRQRRRDHGLHRRPGPGGRMRRLPGAGCRGPRPRQRALGELPPLSAGDLRPERGGVAPSRP